MVRDRSRSSVGFDIFNMTFLILLALICILPLWYTLCLSLSEKAAAAGGMVGLLPVGFNLNSYAKIVGDMKFLNAFWISVQRVFLGTAVSLVVTILMAYPLSKSKRNFPARNIVMWILIFCMLFNGGLVPWYITMQKLNLIDSIWGLVLGGGVPVFNVILVMNFFRNLPKEMEEAALVDGAGPWYMLIKIFFPLSVPVLATVSLFTIVGHWNEFFMGLVLMTSQDKYPLQTYIQQLVVVINTTNMTQDQFKQLNQLSNQTLNAAKIFVAIIPVLAIYPFLQRYFISGITLGAVKE